MEWNDIIGTMVVHKSLGRGTVVNTEENKYIRVGFDNGKDGVFLWSDFSDYFSSDSVVFNNFLKQKNEERDARILLEQQRQEEKRRHQEDVRKARELLEQQRQEEEKRRQEERIKETVKSRNIQILLHFTAVDNLESILEKGILSRVEMYKQGISAVINDENRFDSCLDGISCSVTLPNAPLLYKFQKEKYRKYVLLGIKPDVLWEKECLFCKENAASGKVFLTPFHSTAKALEGMFGDYDAGHTRKELENLYTDGFIIEDNMPTHNQAEVLVKQRIEPEYITGVYVFKEDCSESFVSQVNETIKRYPKPVYCRCLDDFMRRCKQPEKGFWENTKRVYNEISCGVVDDDIPF